MVLFAYIFISLPDELATKLLANAFQQHYTVERMKTLMMGIAILTTHH